MALTSAGYVIPESLSYKVLWREVTECEFITVRPRTVHSYVRPHPEIRAVGLDSNRDTS